MSNDNLYSYYEFYHPYKGGNNPMHASSDGFSQAFQFQLKQQENDFTIEDELVDYLRAFIYKLRNEEKIKRLNTLSSCFPAASTVGKINERLACVAIRASEMCGLSMDYMYSLERTSSLASAHSGGQRNVNAHDKSLRATGNYTNKTVILFDDVVTSGKSLEAGRKVLNACYYPPEKVSSFALCKTCALQDDHNRKKCVQMA